MAIESRGDGDGAEYLDVLLLCAAPLDVRPALNLAVEVANFEAEVRRSPVPIRLRRVFPPTFEQLRRELAPTVLQGREPRVFHFLGHGEEDYLWFEDEEAGGEKVTAARLRRLFEGTPIRLALLERLLVGHAPGEKPLHPPRRGRRPRRRHRPRQACGRRQRDRLRPPLLR